MRAPLYSEQPDELFRPEQIENPHPFYARLRASAPLSRVADTGVHLVATWDGIEEVLAREVDFSANLTGALMRGEGGEPTIFGLPGNVMSKVLATADEPDHSVHRAIAQPRLAVSRAAKLEGPLRRWTRAAIEAWIAEGAGDFVPVAEWVPARVVADLLGLPERDVPMFRKWAMMGGDILAGAIEMDRLVALAREALQMTEYLGEHLDAALGGLQQGADAPLLHALAGGILAGQIDRDQAVEMATIMFGAGGESTAALIGSAVKCLAAQPELAQKLREDPALVPRFVEEVVRLEPPFKFHYRVVRRPCELAGYSLDAGDRLMLLWASANRDAEHFEDPDALRLDRRFPKQHLSFGRGGHFCIGAAFARLEARVVCEELLAASKGLALADAAPRYANSIFVRRFESLPLAVSS